MIAMVAPANMMFHAAAPSPAFFSIVTPTVKGRFAGFDVEHIRAVLEGKADSGEPPHFGLHNIYERIRTAYGSAEVRFSSTPFFYNRIQFLIPADNFRKSQATVSQTVV